MNFTFFNKAHRVLLIPLMLLFSVALKAQCDVFIEENSIDVVDNGQLSTNEGCSSISDSNQVFSSINNSLK